MRKVIEEFNVYRYAELSEDAKEKVRTWYIEGVEYVFKENCLEKISKLFPDSDLEIQYSLNSCQGDGFNIYGEICFNELLEKIAENFTEKEMKFFKWVFKNYDNSYMMSCNNRYCYCICSRNDFTENLIDDMEYDNIHGIPYRGVPYRTLEKFNKLAGEYLDNLCREFEKEGYDWFYNIPDSDVQEHCEDNEYEFLEDGKLYATGI